MLKKTEQLLKKILLRLLIFLKKKRNVQTSLPLISENTKVLFVRLNRIGDALVSTPVIELIKQKTGCKVYILADKKNHFIFSNNPNIDRVLIFGKGVKGFNKVLRFIEDEKINIIVDLHDDVSTTVSFLFALAKVDFKFGLLKSNNEIYTHSVIRMNPSTTHIVERLLKLSELFGINDEKEIIKIRYYPKSENLNYAKEILNQRFSEKKFLLGINISAGSDARFWGIDNYKSLINSIQNYNLNYIFFCDSKDFEKAKSITEERFIYPVSKEFDKFAAGVLQVDLLFSPDTSAIHIASMKGIPVFGLYVKFKTQDMIWTPYKTDFDCIITEEPTLQNINFEDVKKKFLPFLEKHLNAKRNTIL